MKACIVDDDNTSRQILEDFLTDQGWETVTFSNPDFKSSNKKYLPAELADPNVKLLVMDIRFGRNEGDLKKGLDTVGTLVKENKIDSKIKIIFVSQFGKAEIHFDPVSNILNEKNIKHFWFDKPIDLVELFKVL